MTVVSLNAIQTKPGASWEDIQKYLKKGNDLTRKHGGENVTTLAGMAAGTATGTLTTLITCADWTSYGKFQDVVWGDPELQALTTDPNSPIAGWHSYIFQTIPDL
jgi:hypothetical protein